MPAPILQRPTYIDGAPADEAIPALRDAGRACRRVAREQAGLLTATLVGVTAAYFAPKVFDWALARFRDQLGGRGPDQYDLELEDDGQ